MFFTTLSVIGLRALLVWENKKLDRQYGTLQEQLASRAAKAAVENYGPAFRYVL
jgi:hypothetical protein